MNRFKRSFFLAAFAALVLIAAPPAAFAGPLDFGAAQVNKDVTLKAGVPAVGTFTVTDGLDNTTLTSATNPATVGNAAVTLTVTKTDGTPVALSSFTMNTAASRPLRFPSPPGAYKFSFVSKQDIAFSIAMRHGVDPPPRPKSTR